MGTRRKQWKQGCIKFGQRMKGERSNLVWRQHPSRETPDQRSVGDIISLATKTISLGAGGASTSGVVSEEKEHLFMTTLRIPFVIESTAKIRGERGGSLARATNGMNGAAHVKSTLGCGPLLHTDRQLQGRVSKRAVHEARCNAPFVAIGGSDPRLNGMCRANTNAALAHALRRE